MISRLRQLYIPIFTQITVPYILLAILIAGGATYIITRVIFDSVQERFSNQLVETALLAHESLVREEDDLLAALRFISHIQGIDEAVDHRLFSRLRELVLPVAFNSSIDSFAILDANGLSLLSLRINTQGDGFENLNPESPLRQLDFVQNVLEGHEDEAGDKFSGIVVSGSEEYFFVSGPILRADGTLAGAALAGRTVTNLASHVREETLAQCTFYSMEGLPFASTLGEEIPLTVDAATNILGRQDEASYARLLHDSGIDYNELLSPWEARGGEDLGLLGVALPTNFLVQASQFSRSNTLYLTVLALLLVLLVGVFVAQRITSPIQDLKSASLKVAEGDLQISVTPRSRDEIGILAQSFNAMVSGLNQSKRELLNAYDETIEGWARATDLRDHETEDHSRRVADLTLALAQAMGVQSEQLIHMRRGALLHDIGKIAIPDRILLKPGRLTETQTNEMRKHPEYARSFLEQIEFLKPAMDIPYTHHERWDGSGYPRGLKGAQIPLAARIFTVVDVWDALTSDRPYRAALGFDDAMQYITSQSGSHFDPKVVVEFKKMMGR